MKKIHIIIVFGAALVLIALVVALGSLYSAATIPEGGKVVYVERGMPFRAIANRLETEGVIKSAKVFGWAAGAYGVKKKVKAGEYEFSGSLSMMQVLDALRKGRVKVYQVTIPEGYNISDVASAFAATGLVEKKDFLSRAKDRNFAKTFGIEGATFEGYLYPDTYNFEKGVTPDEIITKMTQKFLSVYNAEIAPTAKTRKISMTGLVTLASIVEKETGAGAERDMVASVYRNRLKRRMRLQSDPTVIYGIEKFNGNLTRKDLATKTPYNTYTNYGLPPGPIANPGRASLLAALNPADTDYLYFVSMNNGTHRFSKTLKEHNAAVDEFQRSRRGRRR